LGACSGFWASYIFTMNTLGIDKPAADTRVIVAMSGGVDSSATAALLADEGYDVVGVTLQLYDHGEAVDRPGTCCAGQDIHDARRVADTLGIPHYVLDYESRFKGAVIEDFADTYLRGETPIPCVRCNQTVKFQDLLATARDLGGDALVSGHYVRWRQGPEGPELYRGTDPVRDQSYFLFATTREQLSYLRFPLGGMDKSETRELARRFNLPVAAKPDSQDICFVPDGNYSDVVAKLRPGAFDAGEIVDLDGNVLGHHDGIIHYTVGQRRGLGISAPDPLYVVRIEADQARIVAGPKAALLRDRVNVRDVNWIGPGDGPEVGHRVTVKLRSTQPPVAARLHPTGEGHVEVALEDAQGAVAPGQACVFYDHDRVLGGGWIAAA